MEKQPLEIFCKKRCFPEISQNSQKKHLCQSLFSNKVAGLRPAILFKKALAQVISCEFCEMFKNNVFAEHLRATTSDIYKKFHVQPILC